MIPPSPWKIQLNNISKDYGEHQVHALKGIQLQVAEGEFIALMGPSGCGKSTLLNLIGAMDTPSSGEIWVGEQNITTLPESNLTRLRRETLGFIFQFFNLLSALTVAENIALPLELGQHKLSAKERHQKIKTLLDEVGMRPRADFYPAQLSGGEMQRVAIARALIHNPDIILADEPTGNLDSENGQHVLELLQRLCKEKGKTVLMATHSEEAAEFADRVIRMRDGQIIPSLWQEPPARP